MPKAVSALPPIDLSSHGLFADLDAAQQRQLLVNHRLISLQAGQPLLHEQDDGQVVFLFLRGLAKVRSIDAAGREVVLSVLGPGELCGELAMLQAGRRSADVICLTDCELLLLQAGPFQAMVQSEAKLSLALARLLAARLCQLGRRYLNREASATTRLLQVLSELASRSSPGGTMNAVIPALPQRELAALAGLARETASRALMALRRQGLVEQLPGGRLRLLVDEPIA